MVPALVWRRVTDEGRVGLRFLCEALIEALERLNVRERVDVLPHLLRDPLGRGVLGEARRIEHHAARQQVAPLGVVELVVALHEVGAQQQREGQLVLLKERAADVLVQEVLKVRVEVLHAHLQVAARLRIGDRAAEEVDEPVERVLVHRVDGGERGDAEEEHSRAVRDGLVRRARLVDLDLGLVGNLLLGANLVGELLGAVKDLNGRGVLEDRAARRLEHLEDLVFHLGELLLVGGALLHQPALLLFEVGPLLGHHDAEQLVFQTIGRDHEVEQRHFDLELRQVVRVAQLGGDVELEVGRVLDGRVAQPDALDAGLLEGLLDEQRLERRVELLEHVLAQYGLAELDRVLERAQVVVLRELDHEQPRLGFELADPLVGLPLRVDHQRPAARHRRHNAVVDGEGVGGQALHVPSADAHGVAHDLLEVKLVRLGDALLVEAYLPLVERELAVGNRKRAEVRDHASRDQHVPQQVEVLGAEVSRDLAPAHLLAAESAHELLGALELVVAVLVLGVQTGHGLAQLLELALHRLELVHDHLELGLLDGEPLHRLGVLALGLRERLLLGAHHLGDAVVDLNGAHPLAQPLARGGGLGNALRLKLLHRAVLLADTLDDLGRDVVLVVLLEALDEGIGVHEHLLAWPEVVLDHLARVLVLDLFGLDIFHHAHRLERELDARGRIAHGLDEVDVGLLERVERRDGRVERGDGLSEVGLALLLHGLGLGRH